ncbi:MAG: flagellar biosynthesis anti-sigma factor FlgM [Betaproteobacteria bacterium]|nr:flagellar biosynthesis anti-sigma factor FlgM [Betaproteobacteria bacterium]
MDIKGLNTQTLNGYRPQAERTEDAAAAKLAKSKIAHSGGESDTLRLSHEARLRTTARSTAMQADDVRQERVDDLKKQVADGTYQVDTTKTATKLLQEESDIFRPGA